MISDYVIKIDHQGTKTDTFKISVSTIHESSLGEHGAEWIIVINIKSQKPWEVTRTGILDKEVEILPNKPLALVMKVNSPKGAICARAEIVFSGEVGQSEAMAARLELHLAEKEIRSYMAGSPKIGIYRLGSILFAEPERTSQEIGEQMIYHPPQSFFRLSAGAKELLDEMCGF